APDRIVYIEGLGAGSNQSGLEGGGAAVEAAAGFAHRLVSALRELSWLDDVDLVVVTHGSQPAGTPVVNPWQAALWGLGADLLQAEPLLRCRLVDLDPAEPRVDLLAEEILAPADGEPRVALRAGARLVPRLVRYYRDQDADVAAGATPADDGVIHVLDGTESFGEIWRL